MDKASKEVLDVAIVNQNYVTIDLRGYGMLLPTRVQAGNGNNRIVLVDPDPVEVDRSDIIRARHSHCGFKY